ncbi:MAG: hypothetical protein LBQ12_05465 [Deltaproteobacteria bacterium]|jgi:hypothetical protein|nr:hypothetical protein [Deltaproteobacteria bacterium]
MGRLSFFIGGTLFGLAAPSIVKLIKETWEENTIGFRNSRFAACPEEPECCSGADSAMADKQNRDNGSGKS